MSTRYLIKDNVIIVGLAKNGSQSIKQIGLRNEGFEIIEDARIKSGDYKIDFMNPDLLILFPLRDVFKRGYSEMLQYLQKIYEWESFNYLAKQQIETILGYGYTPSLNYVDSYIVNYFLKNIFLNDDWKGCQIKFFDLDLLDQIPNYLGWGECEVPWYNTWQKDLKKKEIVDLFLSKNTPYNKVHLRIDSIHIHFNNFIKRSKYWIKNETIQRKK